MYFIASFFEHLYPAGFRKTPHPGVFYFSDMIMKDPDLSPDSDLCSIDKWSYLTEILPLQFAKALNLSLKNVV